jgi:hypothetical protein
MVLLRHSAKGRAAPSAGQPLTGVAELEQDFISRGMFVYCRSFSSLEKLCPFCEHLCRSSRLLQSLLESRWWRTMRSGRGVIRRTFHLRSLRSFLSGAAQGMRRFEPVIGAQDSKWMVRLDSESIQNRQCGSLLSWASVARALPLALNMIGPKEMFTRRQER